MFGHIHAQDVFNTLKIKNMRLFKTCATLTVMCFSMFLSNVPVFAAGSGDIVINEIAWAGSADASGDEWIELFNNTGGSIDLAGWSIEDDDTTVYEIDSGVVDAYGYFLIEDSEDVTSVVGDAVVGLSLANSGDKLVLKDATGNVVDVVNSAGGAWFAGDSAGNASMERIDSTASGDDAGNWNTAGSGNGAVSSGGSSIVGTPGGLNSQSSVPATMPKVEMIVSESSPQNGDVVSVVARASNISDLFSYGFDLVYDPAVLKFVDASENGFLNESGGVNTSFNYGLEDGVEGRLVVGAARTVEPKTFVSGDGDLFTINFEVIGVEGDGSGIVMSAGSFLANDSADLGVGFVNATVGVSGAGGSGGADAVTGLTGQESANRYELEIKWSAPVSGADSYKILRKAVDGGFVEIAAGVETSFVDKDGVNGGGGIVPGVEYAYRVVSVKNGIESLPVDIAVTETRGLKGDNTRSDRIDGRDLENLARHFGEDYSDAGFNRLVDTNYDGSVDASDLIDLAANWAKKYEAS